MWMARAGRSEHYDNYRAVKNAPPRRRQRWWVKAGTPSTVDVMPSARLRDARRLNCRVLPDTDLCLISCGRRKRRETAPARVLYCSARFQRTRRFVEERGWRWFILSARHGLLHPERAISPYDETLGAMSEPDRRKWAEAVLDALRRRLVRPQSVIIFADCVYSAYLVPALRNLGISVCDLERDWLVTHGPLSESGSRRRAE